MEKYLVPDQVGEGERCHEAMATIQKGVCTLFDSTGKG